MKNKLIYKTITWGEFGKSEAQLIEFLQSYCIKNDLKFCVLGRHIDIAKQDKKKNEVFSVKDEYNYFANLVRSDNWQFIENTTHRKTYKILDSAKLVTGIAATLLFESLGRGNKTILFNIRPNVLPFNSQTFGYLSNLPNRGPFWLNEVNKKIFQETTDYIINLSEIEWKKVINSYPKDIMKYDFNNSILKRKLNQYGVNTLN